MDKIKDLDLYELLELTFEADEALIRKAYRKKALKCHPDKNPDNPKAIALFHQLSDALTILVDPDARKAYDNLLKARKAAKIRHQQLDAKRQKLIEDLEQREKAARESTLVNRHRTDEEKLMREVERLRKENKKLLEEEYERMNELLKQERAQSTTPTVSDGPTKVKVKWSGGEYSKEMLQRIFLKYGEVLEVAVLPGKKGGGSGLVELDSRQAAECAANIERGFAENPLKVKLLLDKSSSQASSQKSSTLEQSAPSVVSSNFEDYETLVMRQMRQQEERRKLIEEMERQDALEDN